jgi:hypothetical protein
MCVSCEVRTGFLYIVYMNLGRQGGCVSLNKEAVVFRRVAQLLLFILHVWQPNLPSTRGRLCSGRHSSNLRTYNTDAIVRTSLCPKVSFTFDRKT